MNATRRDRIRSEILTRKISAIIRTRDQTQASEAMHAVVRGGFRLVEFTMTTPGALELIGEFAGNADLLVGAGTVLTPEQAGQAVAAGARFIVSPVFDPEVVACCRALDVVGIPGTVTPTEMAAACRRGADFVKLFPFPWPTATAEYVAAVLGPLPHLRIFPTAGVTPENFVDILQAGAAGVGFVRSLFDPQEMARRDWASIEHRAADIVRRLERFLSPRISRID